MKKLLTIEDSLDYLRIVSEPVDFEKDNIDEMINDLKEYCINNEVYALSPVQIGIPKRIMYIKNTNQDMDLNKANGKDESIVFINPRIIEAYGETYFLECCQSCQYKNGDFIGAVVKRPYRIVISYFDRDNNEYTKTLLGFEATVFCHEYDHFYGIFHSDRVKDAKRMSVSEVREYRTKHPQIIVSKTNPFPLDKYLKFNNEY